MIYISNKDSRNLDQEICVDMVFTDPPFDMSGEDIVAILNNFEYQHLFIICTMSQAFYINENLDLHFEFDLINSFKTPTKNISYIKPHIVHVPMFYFRKRDAETAFDRSLVKRYDQFSLEDDHYYYPTIFDAPKTNMKYKYQKNQAMINDLVGSFDVESICDPFAGSGTTGLACAEHKKNCYLIEKDPDAYEIMRNNFMILKALGYDVREF